MYTRVRWVYTYLQLVAATKTAVGSFDDDNNYYAHKGTNAYECVYFYTHTHK